MTISEFMERQESIFLLLTTSYYLKMSSICAAFNSYEFIGF